MTAQILDDFEWQGTQAAMLQGPGFMFNDARLERGSDPSLGCSTACARGYVAYWGLRENALFLLDIRGTFSLPGGVPLPIQFTGTIKLGLGEATPVFYGTPLFESYVLLELREGILVSTRLEGPADLASSGLAPAVVHPTKLNGEQPRLIWPALDVNEDTPPSPTT